MVKATFLVFTIVSLKNTFLASSRTPTRPTTSKKINNLEAYLSNGELYVCIDGVVSDDAWLALYRPGHVPTKDNYQTYYYLSKFVDWNKLADSDYGTINGTNWFHKNANTGSTLAIWDKPGNESETKLCYTLTLDKYIGTAPTSPNQSWMGDLLSKYPSFGDTKLNKLIMVGSHDSGTTGLGNMAQTQYLSLTGQLELGLRYLDLRVKVSDHVFMIHHTLESDNILGAWKNGAKAQGDQYLFNTMAKFLKRNTKEIIILKFQSYKNFGSQDYADLIRLIKASFTFPGCKLVTTDHGTRPYVNQLTINGLLGEDKRVMIIFTTHNIPATHSLEIFQSAYAFQPSSTKLEEARMVLWDPFWHDKGKSVGDDDPDNLKNVWYPYHKSNIAAWNGDGLFCLQSHMEVLPGYHIRKSDFVNDAEKYAAANSQGRTEAGTGRYICNNRINMQEYLRWAEQGMNMNIVIFDFVDNGNLVQQVVDYYEKTLA